jgi:hypothetical protein
MAFLDALKGSLKSSFLGLSPLSLISSFLPEKAQNVLGTIQGAGMGGGIIPGLISSFLNKQPPSAQQQFDPRLYNQFHPQNQMGPYEDYDEMQPRRGWYDMFLENYKKKNPYL